jgi:Ca-activated chloride channel family protein
VVLTDGRDTASLIDEEEALAAVRRAGITVYAISPAPRTVLPVQGAMDHRLRTEAAFLLTTLSEDTGGRAFFLEDLSRLADVYADIAAEIQHQYTLAFEVDKSGWGTKFRNLLVRVISRPDAVVRTRRGYLATRD